MDKRPSGRGSPLLPSATCVSARPSYFHQQIKERTMALTTGMLGRGVGMGGENDRADVIGESA